MVAREASRTRGQRRSITREFIAIHAVRDIVAVGAGEQALPRVLARPDHIVSRDGMSAAAIKVLYRLHRSGYTAYLVGGGVRDLLLGGHPKDFDVATNARPQEIRRLFRNSRIIALTDMGNEPKEGPRSPDSTRFQKLIYWSKMLPSRPYMSSNVERNAIIASGSTVCSVDMRPSA